MDLWTLEERKIAGAGSVSKIDRNWFIENDPKFKKVSAFFGLDRQDLCIVRSILCRVKVEQSLGIV